MDLYRRETILLLLFKKKMQFVTISRVDTNCVFITACTLGSGHTEATWHQKVDKDSSNYSSLLFHVYGNYKQLHVLKQLWRRAKRNGKYDFHRINSSTSGWPAWQRSKRVRIKCGECCGSVRFFN